jgi:hypothetical protein
MDQHISSQLSTCSYTNAPEIRIPILSKTKSKLKFYEKKIEDNKWHY